VSVEKITKEMFRCKCEASHKDGTPCSYQWEPESIPIRCPSCKSRRWNRPRRLSAREPITFNGKTQSIAQWSRELGLSKHTIPWRLKQEWPLEQVLSKEDWRKQ